MVGSMSTCAGSSGGAQPPPNPRKRLYSQCEASQEKRKGGRGPAKGEDIAHFVAIKGRIKVTFDRVGNTYKVIGPHAAWYDSAVGIHTRFCCDPFYDKWNDVPGEQKAKVREGMLSWFDIDFSGILRGVLYRDAGKCYRGWKAELATHFREYASLDEALAKVPESIRDPEQWQKCCARFDSNEFKEKSKTNKDNRGHNTITSHHGRKSYAQYLAEKADPVTKEPYSVIENWKDMRMHEGKWISQEAEQRYDMMNVQRTIQISECGSADERSILRKSHPSHRGHHVGVGPTLPSFWLAFGEESSSSTETSTTSTMEDRARIRRLEETVLDLVDVLRQLAPDRLPPRYAAAPSTVNDDLDDESVQFGD